VLNVMKSWGILLAMRYIAQCMSVYVYAVLRTISYHPQVDVGYCVPTNSGRVMFCTSEVLLAKIRLNPLLMGEW